MEDDMLKVKPQMDYEKYVHDKLIGRDRYEDGSENPDPVPVAPPIGYVEQPNMWEQMRAMIRSEQLRQAAEAAGAETFEEADDFEVEDELFPVSAYENLPDDLDGVTVDDTDRGSTPSGGGKGGGEPVVVDPKPVAEPAPVKPAEEVAKA